MPCSQRITRNQDSHLMPISAVANVLARHADPTKSIGLLHVRPSQVHGLLDPVHDIQLRLAEITRETGAHLTEKFYFVGGLLVRATGCISPQLDHDILSHC
jgi:hypothetical protein